ncbi:Activating signal cointegrator 1 complex subunit 3 [Astathelohania contejeani]|uniref:Activating signal cointegrator 1 complex subunit 3 n=1 Tax=Astathelohania contejeani TaxID=164912 RepID=A0ABQ7HXI1_9MICR|nr:Activating signal cointegrator 1 complex subunit 3 [Thelohania contejeani]
MKELIERIATKLNLNTNEANTLIKQTLAQENYEEELYNILGPENIDEISEICNLKSKPEVKNVIINKNSKELLIPEDYNVTPNYVEHILPTYKSISFDQSKLIPTNSVKKFSQYFKYSHFNPIQSTVFETAYKTNKNMLICAPTGAGKTDVAILTILNQTRGKIIYIVPMKALATEITRKLQQRLVSYKTREYTGDTEVTHAEVAQTDILVCTPEKFDVVTRKQDNVFQRSIGLVIIDEIHMIQDDRGPVIESIVARIFRYIELRQSSIRIIGLSATLPNYKEVAQFMRAEKVYFFDSTYRPVPLKVSLIGLTVNKRRKKVIENGLDIDETKEKKNNDRKEYFRLEKKLNETLIEKIQPYLTEKQQILVFVNSRNDTLNTAHELNKELGSLTKNQNIKESFNDPILKNLIQCGYGIHHAGLPRKIRLGMENLFMTGKIRVLVSTATLAWGVNLPAHAVFIKGTTYYNPDRGAFVDMGILDILQIFGRAGRPQFDTLGEACLITSGDKLSHYLNLLNQQTQIESAMLNGITDLLNSEIALGTVSNIREAVAWVKHTFMYVRMHKHPMVYGLIPGENVESALIEYLILGCRKLEECGMISIEGRNENHHSWVLVGTECGRIASVYYLHHLTIEAWNSLDDNKDILDILLDCQEFRHINLRSDEISSLRDIATAYGLAFEETAAFKKYALIYCMMRGYPIHQFSLACDGAFLMKNMQRIVNAFKEFLLYKRKYEMLEKTYLLAIEIETGKHRKRNYKNNLLKCINSVALGEIRKVRVESKEPALVFTIGNNKLVGCGMSGYEFYTTGASVRFIGERQKDTKIIRDAVISQIERLYIMGGHVCSDTDWVIGGRKRTCTHFQVYYNLCDIISDFIVSTVDITIVIDRKIDMGIIKEEIGEYAKDTINYKISADTVYINAKKLQFVFLNEQVKISGKVGLFITGMTSAYAEIVEVKNYRERQKVMTNKLYRRLGKIMLKTENELKTRDILIIVPTEKDIKETLKDLKILMGIDSFKVSINGGSINKWKNGIFITTLKEALRTNKTCGIIIKGLSGVNGIIYPMYDIYRVLIERCGIIYENSNVIYYLKKIGLIEYHNI